MKKNQKTLAIAVAIVVLLCSITTAAFAAEAEKGTEKITNTGSMKAPVFQAEDGSYLFCLERDVKAPGADGVEYSQIEGSEYEQIIAQVQTVIINFYINGETNPELAGYAIWGILEDEVENYRALTAITKGEEAQAQFDALFTEVTGNWRVTYKVYYAEGYQKMLSAKVEPIMMALPPAVVEPTTEEPTEIPTEEPTTEEPIIEEPIIEELVVEPETEEPTTETPTEPSVETTTEIEEIEVPGGYITLAEEEIPNTGVESIPVILPLLVAALSAAFIITRCANMKKFSLA